ncbi:MAG TPA: AAA family ATPase [Brevundimonas sp.]
MLLEKVTLKGFRRFHAENEIQLSGKMVAIVGSNEAGKTSLLRAISLLGNDDDFEYQDRTYLGTEEISIKAHYFLQEDDLKSAGLTQPTWLVVEKSDDGEREFELIPAPERDHTLRESTFKLLQKFLASSKTRSTIEKNDIQLEYGDIEQLIPILQIRGSEFTEENIQQIDDALYELEKLEGIDLPKYVSDLVEGVRKLKDFEQNYDPLQISIDALTPRLPRLLFFGAADRHIDLPYNLAAYRSGDPSSGPSKPLTQIIKLSGLDMDELVDADASENHAVRTGLLTDANERLRALSEGLWSQSDACLFLTVSNGTLDVLVEHKEGFEARDRYNNLSDRSDGYRQFVALQIFGFLQSINNAILLIDEIEQHLHYDAQADLIQLLQREKSVQKIIYTTHSAGSLPEDLGTGVRLVQWSDEARKHSSIKNKFWVSSEQAGFRPLLFGMGAATLAFFPTRKALIAEGVTEVLLLPRLLREALDLEGLGFQVIHGLANISPKGLPMTDGLSQGVAYIVDGDLSGDEISKGLNSAGVPVNLIFNLKKAGAITVEDLIDRKVWKSAILQLVDRYNPGLHESLKSEHFPDVGRISALPKMISSRKIEIAYIMLDMMGADPNLNILSSSRRDRLNRLGSEIRNHLKLD